MTWTAVLALAAGTYALRLAGPLLRSRVRVPATVEAYLGLGAVALLAALIATSALVEDGQPAGVARPAGVVVGALLALRRAPFLLVVLGAAATAAVLRLAGVP